MRRDSSVNIVVRVRGRRPESILGRGWDFFSSLPRPGRLSGPPSLIQGVPGVLSPGVKLLGREDDHSPPSTAEAKNAWSYASIPPIRLHGVVVKHRDSFTLYTLWVVLSGSTSSLGSKSILRNFFKEKLI